MISALFSFLGGAVFRMIWGEVAAWLTAAREHQWEIELMREQEKIDAAQHERNLAAIRLQADLGVKVIEVQGQMRVSEIETEAWLDAVKGTTQATGIWFVDLWNGLIRPAVATWAVLLVTGNYTGWWSIDDRGWELCGAALGLYLADRALFKRGK